MDEWIQADQMEKTEELVITRENERKKNKMKRKQAGEIVSEEEEHEGMEEQAVLDHQEATKIKTITEIGIHVIVQY